MNYKLKILFTILLYPLAGVAQTYTNKALYEGNEAYGKGELQKAITTYLTILQHDTANDKANYNLGVVLAKSKQYSRAEKHFTNTIINTKDAALQSKAYYNKGLLLILQQKTAEAIEAFKYTLRLTPADNGARENLQKALNELHPTKKTVSQKQQKPLNKKELEEKLKQLRDSETQLLKQRLQKVPVNQQPEKDW